MENDINSLSLENIDNDRSLVDDQSIHEAEEWFKNLFESALKKMDDSDTVIIGKGNKISIEKNTPKSFE